MLSDDLKVHKSVLIKGIESAINKFEQDTGFVVKHVEVAEPGSIKAHNMDKSFSTIRIDVDIQV